MSVKICSVLLIAAVLLVSGCIGQTIEPATSGEQSTSDQEPTSGGTGEEKPNTPPKAIFFVTPPNGNFTTTFSFDASTSYDEVGNIAKYEWNFGDGQTATGKTVTHKYVIEGLITVSLTVTDDKGLFTTTTRQVTVRQDLSPQTVKEFDITAKSYKFSPDEIIVNRSDYVRLKISSDSNYGFSIDKYNKNVQLVPNRITLVEFTADLTGNFTFSCSVNCGPAFDTMKGTLIVK